MDQNKRDCSIVQDLLPNYIEDLTDEVTNEYIKEHIATCAECQEVLKSMTKEIKIEEINQGKEIEYLKGIRRRMQKSIAIISTIIIIVAICMIGYICYQSKIEINNYSFLSLNYTVENEQDTRDGKLYCTLIAVLDNKGICKSVRVVEEGYIEEIAKNKLKETQTSDKTKHMMNGIIKDGKLYYNTNMYNGCTEEELKDKLKINYSIQDFDTI